MVIAAGTVGLSTALAGGSVIGEAPGPTVSVRLLDASTGQPIRDSAVRLISDNGRRCIKQCPTNQKNWRGATDPQGFVTIPTANIQSVSMIDAGTLSGDLIEDSVPAADSTWVVDMLPRPSSYADPTGAPRVLKLIDAGNGHAIADAAAKFEWRRAGRVHSLLGTTTNAMGYVFLPFDLPDGALQNTWVAVAGYQAAHVDFAWAMHKIHLTRRPSRGRVNQP